MENNNTFYEKQIIIGFKTTILALVMFVIELLSLPIYGALQKLQVNGQGFYSEFINYAFQQPYSLIFFITGIIAICGIFFIIIGYRTKNKCTKFLL